MFLTVPNPSELLNLFAMKERGERRETEMGLKIGLERIREYKLAFSFFFFFTSFGECSGTVFSTSCSWSP